MSVPILTCLTFLPLAGGLLLIFLPRDRVREARATALVFSLATFALSLVVYARFDGATAAAQFVERTPWLGRGLNYHVGVDGLSLFLVLITAFLTPIALLSSWNAVTDRVREFSFFMLLLETGMVGVFVSLNLFLFYVFWEAMLIPMYFLIGIWGGRRRVYATTKFVLVTMFGSLLMLVGIFVLYARANTAAAGPSLAFQDLYRMTLPPGVQTWLFLAFALAFAIKIPLFPLHTWLPDAHVEAPTAGSVLLAAVLLKMGAYGFLRLGLPLFPDAARTFLPGLSVLAVIGIIYGGLMALVQKDMKSLVAYSSVSHMGLIMLAIFALNFESTEGALFQMVNHGLSTGALFLCVGLLYERGHTRLIADYGGVERRMPVFSAVFLIAMLSSMGLPGLNGFVGEVLCLFGVLAANKLLAALAVTTTVLSASYLLWLFRRVMQGPAESERVLGLRDMDARERLVLLPVVALIFALGVFPGTVLRKMDASVARYLELVRTSPAARTDAAAAVQLIPPAPPSAAGVTIARPAKAEGSR
ncbi:MAG TPA: NADH-quinone oxidoreductase subunit M [Terriglobales bacterium]|nr:NADH-quinone oxidoreductase subunit M [Terriglobales bacterium]